MNKTRTKIVTKVLLSALVLSSIIYLIVDDEYSKQNESHIVTTPVIDQNTTKGEVIIKGKVVNGIYFHGTNRCYTCNLMEGYIRDVIKDSFSTEFKEGKLTFESINVEDPSKNHYIQDYQLQSISFFISLREDGKELKFTNADMIWKLAKDEAMFKKYIREEIKKYLEM